jgi:hypothetical protein
MRWVHALGAAVAATTLVGSVAKATLSVSIVPVAVSSSAAGTIGGGQTVRTYDLQVTQTATEKFNVANLQLTLASGSGLSGYLYASPNHNNTTAIDPNVTGNSNALDPFDTYVSTPAFKANPVAGTYGTDLNVTGSADWPVGPGSITATVPSNTTNNTTHNQSMNIVWGDSQSASASNTSGAATYTIAQFTIVGNTGGFIKGYFGENLSSSPQFFNAKNASGALATSMPAGVVYVPILGDDDKDGNVGGSDFTTVQNNFGNAGAPGIPGDVDGDGQVGGADFTDVQNFFGNGLTYTPPPGLALGTVVPEPASLALLGLAAGGLVSRRRRA